MKKLLGILNQPYLGLATPRERLPIYIGISIFVTLFLWYFQPFQIHTYPKNKLWLAVRFGMVTFIAALSYHLIAHYLLGIRQDSPSWKFWKWILFTMGLVVSVAIGNFLLINHIYGWTRTSWGAFLLFLRSTVAVGIFPVTVTGLINYVRNERKFHEEAVRLESGRAQAQAFKSKPAEPAKPEGTVLNIAGTQHQLSTEDTLYLQAMENYVAIYRLTSEGTERTIVRHTISKVAEALGGHHFMRCHRSYIVNLSKVAHVNGNAQGLMLRLSGLPDDQYVPVSRKYIATIRERLQNQPV